MIVYYFSNHPEIEGLSALYALTTNENQRSSFGEDAHIVDTFADFRSATSDFQGEVYFNSALIKSDYEPPVEKPEETEKEKHAKKLTALGFASFEEAVVTLVESLGIKPNAPTET